MWESVCVFGRCPVCFACFLPRLWASAPHVGPTRQCTCRNFNAICSVKSCRLGRGSSMGGARLGIHDHHYYHSDNCGREAALKASVNFSSRCVWLQQLHMKWADVNSKQFCCCCLFSFFTPLWFRAKWPAGMFRLSLRFPTCATPNVGSVFHQSRLANDYSN